jgi:site-specific recombinase XerD
MDGVPASDAGNRDWASALNRLNGAYSENTLRGYRTDFRLFEAWCAAADVSALPATPTVVAAFLAAAPLEVSSSTLRRRLASIRKVHRLFRECDPTKDEDVLIALRRALRSRHRRQTQAYGLTAELRDQILTACGDDLAGLRDKALIAVGYDTLCRRSELVALTVDDVQCAEDGSALALIRRAKNDPFGDGRDGYLSARSVQMLESWLGAANIESGWVFRRVSQSGIGANALHPHSVGRILKQRAVLAGVPAEVAERISGHSMRVGAAQDMMASGMGLLPIMRSGGWKSANVVARYVQTVEIAKISMARK